MKKITVVALLLAGVFAFTACSKKTEAGEFTVQKGKLMVGVEIGYPPFEYFEDGNVPAGFDIELGKVVAERLGLEVEFVDTAWDGILAGLDTNRYDCIMSAMTITEERQANYDFTQPYIGNGQSIILLKDSKLDISKPADLKGKSVGYQAETTSDFFMEKVSAAENFTFIPGEYDKVMNAYDDLKYGRIDSVCSDYLVAVSYLGTPDTVYKCVWQGEPDEYFGVCVKKGNKVLQEKIDSVINDMKKDGALKEIYQKVFGMDLSNTIPASN